MSLSLKQQMTEALKHYFAKLDGEQTCNLYELVLNEIEPIVLTMTLQHVNGNQSEAARYLGLNRGTLRKLLTKYGLL